MGWGRSVVGTRRTDLLSSSVTPDKVAIIFDKMDPPTSISTQVLCLVYHNTERLSIQGVHKRLAENGRNKVGSKIVLSTSLQIMGVKHK